MKIRDEVRDIIESSDPGGHRWDFDDNGSVIDAWWAKFVSAESRLDRSIAFMFVFAGVMKIRVLRTICRYRGHDWVDESCGGPESGCMASRCLRCGYSFHEQLY